jgi:hypothetical protein
LCRLAQILRVEFAQGVEDSLTDLVSSFLHLLFEVVNFIAKVDQGFETLVKTLRLLLELIMSGLVTLIGDTILFCSLGSQQRGYCPNFS